MFLGHAQPIGVIRLLQQVQSISIRQPGKIPLEQCQPIISGQVLAGEVRKQPLAQRVGLIQNFGTLLRCTQASSIDLRQTPAVKLRIRLRGQGLCQRGEKPLDPCIDTEALQRVAQAHRHRPVLHQQTAQLIFIDTCHLQDLPDPLSIEIGGFGPQPTQQQCAALPLKRTLKAQAPAAFSVELQQRCVGPLPLRMLQMPTTLALANLVVSIVMPPPLALTIAVQTVFQHLCLRGHI
ncbi:hypothetical protein D3C80_1314940 [compost metagenome]